MNGINLNQRQKNIISATLFTILVLMITITAASARDYQDVRYDPYASYSYISPPTGYYLPNGQVIIERHVVRPAPLPIFRTSRYDDCERNQGWERPNRYSHYRDWHHNRNRDEWREHRR